MTANDDFVMKKNDKWPFGNIGAQITLLFAIVFALYHIAAAQLFAIDPFVVRIGFLAGTVILTFAYWRSPIKGPIGLIIDITMALATLAAAIYVALEYKEMVYRIGIFPTFWDTFFGIIVIVVTIEVARRTLGWGLPVLAVAFLLYAVLGQYLPGSYGHGGFSIERTVSLVFSTGGILGVPLAVSIQYVLPFVIFGAFLEANGTGQYLMDLAKAIAGRTKGGAAKMATIASAGFGSINGSPAANVVSTGVMTIPMMKRSGYKAYFAGAVEAVASTGGQLLPPIMGASAFIMVEILGVPYATIVWAALVPALLYYAAVIWVIHLEADRTGLKGLPKDQIPVLWRLLVTRGHLLIPMFVLIYCLLTVGLSPMRSALFAIVAALIVPMFKKSTRLSLVQILLALASGSKNTVGVATATAAAGIIVGILGMTGVGHRFASIILGLSGDVLFLALLLTGIVALVLGIGMPTTGAYIVTASILPSALIPFGLNPLAVHLFLLYFANISNITPPVALAAFAASGIAQASAMKIAVHAFRLGFVGFIIPFMFIYNHELLLQGDPLYIALTIAWAIVSILAIGTAIQGWYRSRLNWWIRVLLATGAILLVVPDYMYKGIGLGLIVAMFILAHLAYGKSKQLETTEENQISNN